MALCFYGLVVHSKSIDDFQILHDTAVVVENGKVKVYLLLFYLFEDFLATWRAYQLSSTRSDSRIVFST